MNIENLKKQLTKALLVLVGIVFIFYLMLRPKTVIWKEEVPLNTGETIWVKRTVVYKYKGASGNPVDIALRPEWNEELEFNWRGRKYFYEGKANIFLISILDKRVPVLVARASDKNWEISNRYKCTKPFYVQLIPDASGRTWHWPSAIDYQLFGQSANIMLGKLDAEEMSGRIFSVKERDNIDLLVRIQSPSLAKVDPTFSSIVCK